MALLQRIQVSKNFYLDEFVDPHTYFNNDDHGLSLLDKRVIDIAQLLRYLYGKPIYINNWWAYYEKHHDKYSIDYIIKKIEASKTISKWSGIRTPRCTIGGKLSAHRLFKAIDPKGNEIEFFKIVKANARAFYELGLRRLEDIKITKGWLHMDTLERNTYTNAIKIVDLKKETGKIYI